MEILLIQLQDTKQEIVWRCCFFLIVSMITKLDDHFNYMNSINGFGHFWALKSISLIKLTEYVIFLLDAFLFVFVHVCRIIISKIYKILNGVCFSYYFVDKLPSQVVQRKTNFNSIASDEEPIYDQVASDEDYSSIDNLSIKSAGMKDSSLAQPPAVSIHTLLSFIIPPPQKKKKKYVEKM